MFQGCAAGCFAGGRSPLLVVESEGGDGAGLLVVFDGDALTVSLVAAAEELEDVHDWFLSVRSGLWLPLWVVYVPIGGVWSLGLGLLYYFSDKVEDANVVFFDGDVLEAVALTVTERVI